MSGKAMVRPARELFDTGILGSGVIEVCRADVTKVLCVAKEQELPQLKTPATGTSPPALENQEMPIGSGRRSTAGPRKPGAAGPGRRRGARPEKFERTKDAMRNDIQQERLTVAQLENMLEKNLARGTASRATPLEKPATPFCRN